jgi:hypothetical protein
LRVSNTTTRTVIDAKFARGEPKCPSRA